MLRFLFLFLAIFIVHFTVQATVLLPQSKIQLSSAIWRPVELTPPITATQLVEAYQATNSPLLSLSAMRGPAIAKIELSSAKAETWYVLPNANYLDTGIAYWQDTTGITKIADFSQQNKAQAEILMHGQAFPLHFTRPNNGTLWLYINALHYAEPVYITLVPQQHFINMQFNINAISLITLSIMFTLTCMAFILYIKTKQHVALFCAGYIGLHCLGWAMAAGAADAMLPISTFNTHYAGIYIFPFAIASASLFALYLFNFQHKPLSRFSQLLKYFTYLSIFCGIIAVVCPFYIAFLIAHGIAASWVILSLVLGYSMLGSHDFRAKYFFVGNLVYSISLVLFILAHLNVVLLESPELWVLTALAIDCVCIVLSLSEWLKIKQSNYIKVLEQSRIDPLTKVGNRLLLQEKLAVISDYYFIVFIDCDGIKAINDQLGHATGDELLIYVSQLVQHVNVDHTHVFRTGGDEFVCIGSALSIKELDTQSHAMLNALVQIHTQVKSKWPLSGVSYGLAKSSECENYTECLTRADERMYSLKYQRKKHNSGMLNEIPRAQKRTP